MNKEIFKRFPILESERIILRPMLEIDINIIYDFNSSNDTLKYIVRELFTTKKEAEEKISFILSSIKENFAFWWVFTLKNTNEDIGYGGLFDISVKHSRAEIGYGLIKKFWNKGYMSEILETILEFGIVTAKFHKTYGVIVPGNDASIKLLEKNNFKKEAHLKEHSFARGKYFDETIYSLINEVN